MEIPTPVCELVRNDSVVRGLGSPYGGAVTALAVTERALSAPYGGTSPIGRGEGGFAASAPNSNLQSRWGIRAGQHSFSIQPWDDEFLVDDICHQGHPAGIAGLLKQLLDMPLHIVDADV